MKRDSSKSSSRWQIGQLADQQVFDSLYLSLRILGFLPNVKEKDRRKSWKTLTFANWLVLIIAHTYLFHLAAATCHHTLRHATLFEVMPNAIAVMRFLAVVISMDHFIFGKQELHKYMLQILRFSKPLSASSLNSIRRFSVFCLVLGWFYTFVSVLICFIVGALTDVDEYLGFYVYEINKYMVNDSVLPRLIVFNDMFEYEFILSVDMFVILFYLMMVYLIKVKICDFNTEIKSKLANLWEGDLCTLASLSRTHTELVEIVRIVDNKYSGIVFLWYMDVVVNIMFSVPTLFLGAPFSDPVTGLYFLWDLFTSFMKFILVSFVVSEITWEEEQLEKTVKLPPRNSYKRFGTIACNTLTSKLSSSSLLYFTGLKTFRIRKGMVVSVIGGVIAYTVILANVLHQNDN